VVAVGNFIGRKRIFGGLKAYLRAADHTSSNIISRDLESTTYFSANQNKNIQERLIVYFLASFL
jgi:hypothetical protein